MAEYFLFGTEAIDRLHLLEEGEDVGQELSRIPFGVYVWNEQSTPEELHEQLKNYSYEDIKY